MADEIVASVSLTATKGNIKFQRAVSNQKSDMAGTNFSAGSWSAPTTAGGTAIPFNSSVGSLGMAFFRNADATNYVEIGVVVSATFYPLLRLLPGEVALFRFSPAVTPYALAHTGAVDLEFGIVEA
jgi:hypothetical protein